MGSFRILAAAIVAFVAVCGGSAAASPVAAPKKHADLQALARGLVEAGDHRLERGKGRKRNGFVDAVDAVDG